MWLVSSSLPGWTPGGVSPHGLGYDEMTLKLLVAWWLNQPIWKICASEIGSFPQGLGQKWRIFETTTTLHLSNMYGSKICGHDHSVSAHFNWTYLVQCCKKFWENTLHKVLIPVHIDIVFFSMAFSICRRFSSSWSDWNRQGSVIHWYRQGLTSMATCASCAMEMDCWRFGIPLGKSLTASSSIFVF